MLAEPTAFEPTVPALGISILFFSADTEAGGGVGFPKPLKPLPNADPRWLSGLSELPMLLTESRAFGVVKVAAEAGESTAAGTVRRLLPFDRMLSTLRSLAADDARLATMPSSLSSLFVGGSMSFSTIELDSLRVAASSRSKGWLTSFLASSSVCGIDA